MRTCSNGHPDRGPLDRTNRGDCRHCEREAAARYRRKQKAALDLMRRLESAGIDVNDVDKAERIMIAAKIVELSSEGLSNGQAQILLQRDAKLRSAVFELLQSLATVTRRTLVGPS